MCSGDRIADDNLNISFFQIESICFRLSSNQIADNNLDITFIQIESISFRFSSNQTW